MNPAASDKCQEGGNLILPEKYQSTAVYILRAFKEINVSTVISLANICAFVINIDIQNTLFFQF